MPSSSNTAGLPGSVHSGAWLAVHVVHIATSLTHYTPSAIGQVISSASRLGGACIVINWHVA